MKKKVIVKFILLSMLSIFLLWETVYTYKSLNPWGLIFAVGTLPFALLSIIAIYYTIKTLKSIIKNNDNREYRKSCVNRKTFRYDKIRKGRF